MMDKLFDGSAAHLLPGNAELIANLRKIGEVVAFYAPLAAGSLEAAGKRIAELEAAIIGWKADQKENMATAVEECKRANEAERKLAVAQEALEVATTYSMLEIDRKIIVEALAQIGGDDAG